MFENKNEINIDAKNKLIKSLTLWQSKNLKNEQDYFNCFYQDNEYLLKMLWQNRLDKMSIIDKDLYIWISENYSPKELEFDSKKLREIQFKKENTGLTHNDLAYITLQEVWKDYLVSDMGNIPKPPPPKVSFLKKLFK